MQTVTPAPRRVRRGACRTGGLLLLLVLVSAACGGGAGGASSAADEDGTTAGTASAAASTSAPSSTTPTSAPPVRLVLTGDSVMQQVAAALLAAFDGPEVHATFASTIAVADRPETVAGWQTVTAVDPPDVVVVLVGTWEREAVSATVGGPDWPTTYLDQVAPFVDTVVGAGAEVVWSSYPPASGADAGVIAGLNEAFAALPQRFAGVTFVPAAAEVSGPDGSRVERLVDEDGREVVVRDTSVHLCPDGVVRMARPLVAELEDRLGVAPADGWEQGPWREDPALFTDAEACRA